MPATEQTWYNQKVLHAVFASVGVALLGATLWMFAADHSREWKVTQRTYIDAETRVTAWRDQALADDTEQQHEVLMARLLSVRSQPIPENLLQEFQDSVHREAAETGDSNTEQQPSDAQSQSVADVLDPSLKAELDKQSTEALSLRQVANRIDQLLSEQNAIDQAQQTQEAANGEPGAGTSPGGRTQGAIAADIQALAGEATGETRVALTEAGNAAAVAEQEIASGNGAKATEARRLSAQALSTAFAQADQAAIAAEIAASKTRELVLARLRAVVDDARFREDKILRDRKFKAAEYDEARATRDLYVRDSRTSELASIEARIAEIKVQLDEFTLAYEAATSHRRNLQDLIGRMTSEEDAVQKEIAENRAEIERLRKSLDEQKSTYFVGAFPWLGKRWLELPILDAFNSPRKINNLWKDGLTLQYGSFSKVRRFDRCTTCHQAIDKTMPGSATEPAYPRGVELRVVLSTPDANEIQRLRDEIQSTSGQREGANAQVPLTLKDVYGLELADYGLINRDDVAISFVQNNSRASRASLLSGNVGKTQLAEEILEPMLHAHGWDDGPTDGAKPGLMLGDVITHINSNVIVDRKGAERQLLETVTWGQPITLTIRRGMPNPFASHPRLDLFVGSLSPHPITTFGCTVCHEGQGSATSFKWASHTPNSPDQAKDWREEYGWFSNHHWIFPMQPQRFMESTCLKCHHNVTELQTSERFPDPPAPTLLKGFDLISTYGCYGCHEINGYDGPDRRIGPDLRLEPNFFAAAQQLLAHIPLRSHQFEQQLEQARQATEQASGEGGLLEGVDLNDLVQLRDKRVALEEELEQAVGMAEQDAAVQQRLDGIRSLLPQLAILIEAVERISTLNEMSDLAKRLVDQPEQDQVRRQLHRLLTQDIQQSQEDSIQTASDGSERAELATALGPESHKLESVLKDVEVPGTMRKPGPALRYVATKNDQSFLLDWIYDPRHFRPSTRMPKFFGLTKHLEPHHGKEENHAVNDLEDSPDAKARNEAKLAPHEMAKAFEPIEALGMSLYLLDRSQPFEFLTPPEGVVESTVDEQAARGKTMFETRGCLACHNHDAFPEAADFRQAGEILQGPDLSGLGSKFDPQRNPDGARWLYSWIKEPTRYHARTTMPDLFLDPYKDNDGNLIDPALDIVTFLLSSKKDAWEPSFPAEFTLGANGDFAPDSPAKGALRDLSLEFLRAAVYAKDAEVYYANGIPEERRGEFKGAEVELVAPSLNDRQRLIYVGAKAISKYGCYGCHDIPGFEDAKPIGTGLADWGRKDTSRLAFEHITHYIEHGHSGQHGVPGHGDAAAEEEIPPFHLEAIEARHREGFLYQKLREPRSYDFEKADNKNYNEWLRMPQFPFNNQEREEVMTFVLGLVAEPPASEFVYQPNERQHALNEGRRVLSKYNCGGCHTLEMERWSLTFAPGEISPPPTVDTFSFVRPHPTPSEVIASQQTDRRGMLHATIVGQPFVDDDGIPSAMDDYGDPVEIGENYDANSLTYRFQLFEPAVVDGNVHMIGPTSFNVKSSWIDRKYPANGGYLARYLVPRVTQLEREVNPSAKASEAWGWVPPPLVNQGKKVQPEWLYNFLLNPYPIRPATFLRMPRFNMSPAEAQALVDYFAARDNATYPYDFLALRQPGLLDERARQYQHGERLDDAMKIVTDNSGCVKCHLVSDFVPQGSPRAKAPDLADVYRRLRAEYVKPWIARPSGILPYTSMPENIHPQTGFAVPGLYHGTPMEQLDGLVDLLMNYDSFAQKKTSVRKLVEAGNPMPPAEADGEPAAEAPEKVSEDTSALENNDVANEPGSSPDVTAPSASTPPSSPEPDNEP